MSNSYNPGLSFTSLLTLIFITIKLTNVITWSWLWVFSPIWISLLIGGVILMIFALFCIIRELT